MSKATKTGVDRRVIRSLAHPLRLRILHELNSAVRSPSELAQEFAESLPNVSYHFKILLENEAIELVRTRPVRGALEHFYRATMRPRIDDDLYARLPKSSRRALAAEGLESIWQAIGEAAGDGGFDDAGTHVSLTRLALDDEAYAELTEHLAETLELAMRLEAESRKRSEAGAEPSHETQLAILHFHRAEARSAERGSNRG